MKKRLCLLLSSIIITALLCSSSCAYVEPKKYTGPLLTNVQLYQLGSSEFIFRLYGRDLPAPELEFNDDFMKITLYSTRAENPDNINSTVNNSIESLPVLTGFNIRAFSDDEGDKVTAEVEAVMPLKSHSVMKASRGWNIRIQGIEPKAPSVYATLPPPRRVMFPESTLPFRADTKIEVLELRDEELRHVLRMLMSALGRNVIIDPSFPDNILITMTLADVRVDEVLNYLLRTYDISCYTIGPNTTAFGMRENLYRLSGQNETKTFNISYADPATVKTLLTAMVSVPDADIAIDERLKKLYVKTNPAKMEEVIELIDRVDTPSIQIMIQASIFEFSDTATKEVERALQIAYDEWVNIEISPQGGLNVEYNDLLRRQRTGIQRTITGQFTQLQYKGKGKILANPSVITTDGQEATISLTEDYPYISARDDAGNPTWSTEEIGPQLTFTPRVGRDGNITLKLNMQTGNVIGMTAGSNGEQMPQTSTRSVTTEVRVKDGMPFVIGGLFRDDNTSQKYKFPVLGGIPLLGDLFNYNQSEHTKSQVVMVVTPYILDSR